MCATAARLAAPIGRSARTASAEAADLEAVDDGVRRGVVVGVVRESLVDAEVVRAVVRAPDHLDELLVVRDHDELEVGLLLARLGRVRVGVGLGVGVGVRKWACCLRALTMS